MNGDAVEFGCGYGTFTLPAARQVFGTLPCLDIEPELADLVQRKTVDPGLQNPLRRATLSKAALGDSGSQAKAMIYNLLHTEGSSVLLKEARRILRNDGVLSVMHWRSDIPTPRGPPISMRPTPDVCKAVILAAGFRTVREVSLLAAFITMA